MMKTCTGTRRHDVLTTLYWTWYWNPGLVTLGFFAITIPLAGLLTFGIMIYDMVTYHKNKEKVEAEPRLEVDLEEESA